MRHRASTAAVDATLRSAMDATLHSAMDISKWLADTAVAVRTAENPDLPGYPAEIELGSNAPLVDLQLNKRWAKRHKDSSKDSSILAFEDKPTEVSARRVVLLSEDAGHSSHHETEDDDGCKLYQRRKRHKTRVDRYDPKPRELGAKNQNGGKLNRKPAKKVEESKRSKKDKSAPTVVRSFHAANVPRERLTVST